MAHPKNLKKTPAWVLEFLVASNQVKEKPPISEACLKEHSVFEGKVNPTLVKKLRRLDQS